MQSVAKEMLSIEISCQKFSQRSSCQKVSAQEKIKLPSFLGCLYHVVKSSPPTPTIKNPSSQGWRKEFQFVLFFDLIFWPPIKDCFQVREPE